jgi:hypothetical protein
MGHVLKGHVLVKRVRQVLKGHILVLRIKVLQKRDPLKNPQKIIIISATTFTIPQIVLPVTVTVTVTAKKTRTT